LVTGSAPVLETSSVSDTVSIAQGVVRDAVLIEQRRCPHDVTAMTDEIVFAIMIVSIGIETRSRCRRQHLAVHRFEYTDLS
jgi:hypothetical protein